MHPLIKALLILPGTVLLFIPAVLLWAAPWAGAAWGDVRFWAGAALVCIGVFMAVWTVRLFAEKGRATPAPWDPPKTLVVLGPYRHVRNPMILGVLAILLGEALLLGSWAIGSWWAIFFLANAVYFPFVEEPGLVRRFGESYRRYARHVPRWLPRLRPWNPKK